MEVYELEPDQILSWATDYASYDELESVAKAIYGVYKDRQKAEQPDKFKKAKAYKKKYKGKR